MLNKYVVRPKAYVVRPKVDERFTKGVDKIMVVSPKVKKEISQKEVTKLQHSKIVWLDVSKLKSAVYQRTVNQQLVNRIAENFNWNYVQIILVGFREDNGYYIIDGQHRILGAHKVGIKKLPCQIADTNDEKEEAILFRGINSKHNRRDVSPYSDYMAALYAEDKETLSINKIITNLGYEVGHNNTNTKISAIRTLRSIYNNYNAETLEKVLSVINMSYGKNKYSTSDTILKHLAMFLHNNPNINQNKLIQRLKKKDPQRLTVELKSTEYDSIRMEIFTKIYKSRGK